MQAVDELQFAKQISKALSAARRVLATNKAPTSSLEAVNHTYEDKYILAELLTNSALASQGLLTSQFSYKFQWVALKSLD
jgi:hypothetical protein